MKEKSNEDQINRIFLEAAERNKKLLESRGDSQDLIELKKKRSESYSYIEIRKKELLDRRLSVEDIENLLPKRPYIESKVVEETEMEENKVDLNSVEIPTSKRVLPVLKTEKDFREDSPEDAKVEDPIYEEMKAKKEKQPALGRKLAAYGSMAYGTLTVFFLALLVINILGHQEEAGLENLSNFFEVPGMFYPKGSMLVLTIFCGWMTSFSLRKYCKVLHEQQKLENSLLGNAGDVGIIPRERATLSSEPRKVDSVELTMGYILQENVEGRPTTIV